MILDTLETFAASVGADRVCLQALDVRPISKGDGVYNSVTRRISVVPLEDQAQLRENVFHELCHAVDLQGDIIDDEDPRFVYDAGREPPVHGAWKLAHEAFAEVCEAGPLSIHLLGQAECGEPERYRDAIAVMMDQVYLTPPVDLGDPPVLDPPVTFDPVRLVELYGPIASDAGFSPTDGGNINLGLSHTEHGSLVTVDAATGLEIPFEGSGGWVYPSEVDLPGIADPPEPIAGWTDGPLIQVGQPDLAPFEQLFYEGRRLLAFDGVTWSFMECLGDQVPFALGSELFVGNVLVDEQLVQWRRWAYPGEADSSRSP